MNDYLSMFIDETHEHLQAWADGVLILEKGMDQETIATVFRAAHTIKGMAMTMGFTQMGNITHQAENILDEVRKGNRVVDGLLIDDLFRRLDHLEALLKTVEDTGVEGNITSREQTDMHKMVSEIDIPPHSLALSHDLSYEQKRDEVAAQALQQGRQVYELVIGVTESCVMPLARFAQVMQQVDDRDVLVIWPEEVQRNNEQFRGPLTLLLAMNDEIDSWLDRIADISEIEVRSVVQSHHGEQGAEWTTDPVLLPEFHIADEDYVIQVVQTALQQGKRVYEVGIRLHANTLLKIARLYMVFEAVGGQDQLLYTKPSMRDIEEEKFSRDVLFVMWSTEGDAALRRAIDGISDIELIEFREWRKEEDSVKPSENLVEKKALNTKQGGKKSGETIRVDVDKLDALMNLFSEIAIDKTRFESLVNEWGDVRFAEAVAHMSRATTDLQELIMSIRMIPVDSIFQRFPRMIRDTARKLEKVIAFEMQGEDTELDRMVAEELGDPLMHLLRNSLDHGIEAAEVRRQRGKDVTGHIQLRAYPAGNRVVIEVEDDGGGIDRDRVLRKAVERGLVAPGAELSDTDIDHLLFAPGFSTSDSVTELSGRGVGLDVVKNTIDKLSGHIEIESTPGQGSKFVITLPMTLALLQSIMLRVDENLFAIPLSVVEEIQEEGLCKSLVGGDVVIWREKVTPIIRLREVFQHPKGDRGTVLFVSQGRKQIGLVVDEVMAQQEIVLKPLPKAVKDTQHFAGATILGNGEVVLILDPSAF